MKSKLLHSRALLGACCVAGCVCEGAIISRPMSDGGSELDAGVLDAGGTEPGVDAGSVDAGTTTGSTVGCSDGTREGFLSETQYPGIAACSGGWSLPGVSKPGIAPACNHNAGNGSMNPEGGGCSSADLCDTGWHVCLGHQEVAKNAPNGCGDAVPPNTPSPGLFFAVAQHSANNSVCDDTSSDDNDVFGCGTLGNGLSSGSGCAPLNVTLASEQPNSCGWNQAMPPIGPWQCSGSNSYNEGDSVTKNGCPNSSCSYSGAPIGSSDEGGVLCCRD